jgi:RNA polymerase sigma-70 factor (ECF subfamily)
MSVPEDRSQRGLVERAQRGDEAAFARLVSSRLDASWRFVRVVGGDAVDADDVVQEAFVRVWQDLPQLRDPAAFDPWLRAVLIHATRKAIRRRRPVRLIPISTDASSASDRRSTIQAEDLVDPHREPGAALASRDSLARAFDRLSVDERTVLVLHYLEGYPLASISTVIRRPIGTVKSRLHGARSALQAALRAEDR